MKYIVLLIIIIVVCYGAALLFLTLINRLRNDRWSSKKIILLCALMGTGILAVLLLFYVQNYYHAQERALEALKSTGQVTVTETKDYIFFDGEGSKTAIVFYPGAGVDTYAYAPLMQQLAESGVDCFLLDVTFHMAVLEINAADDVLQEYDYENYYLAGHSIGGVAASQYAIAHADEVCGVILLASYPIQTVPDGLGFCSIYGSLDGVLDMDSYNKYKAYWPKSAKEFVIEGGNHAGYAYYDKQYGDLTATISREEQQEIAVEDILTFLDGFLEL